MLDRFERFSYGLFEISRYWHKIAADEMAEYDLKGPYATYLTTLYRHKDGITVTELGMLCGKDKADVSRAIAAMEKKGLVTRQAVNENTYRAQLRLTELGQTAAEHVCRRAALAVEQAGKDLSPEKRMQFYEALELIANNLRQLSENGIKE